MTFAKAFLLFSLIALTQLVVGDAAGCTDINGKQQPPDATEFSCFNDCNVCQKCSCSSNGTLIIGGGCTRNLCQGKGCQVGKEFHPANTSGFDCMDAEDCNSCFNCTRLANGKIGYVGAICTYKACFKIGFEDHTEN